MTDANLFENVIALMSVVEDTIAPALIQDLTPETPRDELMRRIESLLGSVRGYARMLVEAEDAGKEWHGNFSGIASHVIAAHQLIEWVGGIETADFIDS